MGFLTARQAELQRRKITTMKTNFSGEENLEKLLDGLPKGNPYTVPEGYFNAFPQKISERIAQTRSGLETDASNKGWSIRPYLAYAAGLALVLSLGYLGAKMSLNEKSISMPTKAIAQRTVRGTYVDFDESSLIQALHEDSRVPKPILGENDNRDAMIQYLVDENVDYTTLVEKY